MYDGNTDLTYSFVNPKDGHILSVLCGSPMMIFFWGVAGARGKTMRLINSSTAERIGRSRNLNSL
jgi:hypothetical protein